MYTYFVKLKITDKNINKKKCIYTPMIFYVHIKMYIYLCFYLFLYAALINIPSKRRTLQTHLEGGIIDCRNYITTLKVKTISPS